MYKFIATGLVTLNSLLFLAMPLQAQEIKEKKDCTATISKAQRIIEAGRSIQVLFSTQDISELYPDHPVNRPYRYVFTMQGSANRSILSSPKFMKSIATNIINQCNSISLVTFGLYASDVDSSIGLMPNGSVNFFDCLEAGTGRGVTWGQAICL